MAKKKKKSGKGSGIMKEMKCSDELQAVVKEKKMGRGKVVQAIWRYIKKHGLQSSKDKRIVKCDDRLAAIFARTIRKDRELKMRGRVIKVPKGRIFMTEMGKALSEHLS